MLKFLYQTIPGRAVLKVLVHPSVSRMAGQFCDSKISKPMIPLFIKKNQIPMEEYEDVNYENFNQCFCRKIKKGYREIDSDPMAFISPCDAFLSAYPIEDGLVIPVKQSRFSIEDLLQDKALANEYRGGTCLVLRLCVHHYHRYVYLDNGTKSDNHFIAGKLHTVQPIALRNVPVFVENSREYTILHTDHFDDVVQMEVGAMLVGRIRNLHKEAPIQRGQEKGYFEYGGSTIILLLKQGVTSFPQSFYEQTKQGKEIPVKQGQRLNLK